LRRAARPVAARFAASPDDAEDILQDALLRAWRMRAQCRSPEAPEAWLRTIVRNEALRGSGRRPVELVGDMEAYARAREETEEVLDRLWLESALRTLSREDALLMRLRYLEDRSSGEIAGVVGMPESTVRVRLHRARAKVRDVI
jgi:RNA polymerase sigma-70 factor (ECF subfamily)